MKKRENGPEAVIANETKEPSDWERLIASFDGGNKFVEYGANRTIFSQGNPADSVFYIREGKVKISVTSIEGKEAIVAILTDGDFFGEGCLAGQLLRTASAYTLTATPKNANRPRYSHCFHLVSPGGLLTISIPIPIRISPQITFSRVRRMSVVMRAPPP
jgi:Cyclic nucleotide-binding domain